MDEINVVAVADKSRNLLSKAEKKGVKKLYENYEELIDKEKDNLDAVIISLPNFLHYDGIIRSFENGLNVFVEKPLAISTSECNDIVAFEENSGRKLMVGYQFRFVDAIQKMKTMLSEGQIGELKYITSEFIANGPLSHGRIPKPISEWWLNPQLSGGGALVDLGTHLVDLYHYFSGDAKVKFCKIDYNMNLPIEDGGTLILESTKYDTRGIINVGWFEKTIFPKFNFRTILHGTADFVSTENLVPRNLYIYAMTEGMKNFFKRVLLKKIIPLNYTYWYSSYYKQMLHFYKAIVGEEEITTNSKEGLKNIETIMAAYKLCREENKYE